MYWCEAMEVRLACSHGCLLLSILLKGPPDAGGELGGANGAGEIGTFAKDVHELLPELWTFSPCVGVADGVDQGHDTIADEDHG